MTDCVIVVGLGPNEVVVPVAVYQDMQTALTALDSLLDVGHRGTYMYNRQCYSWELTDPPACSMQNKLFESYYDGCGECLDIVAIPVKFGELRLFTFNLD